MLRVTTNRNKKLNEALNNIENEIFNLELIKIGGLRTMDFYLFWKKQLRSDLKKIKFRIRGREHKWRRKEDDYSDDFYRYNINGNFNRRHSERIRTRIKIEKLYHYMYKHRELKGNIFTCKRTKMSIEIKDFQYDQTRENDNHKMFVKLKYGYRSAPPSDEDITLFNLQASGGKRNPFSLRHLCIIEIGADGIENLSLTTLEQLYNFLAVDKFAVRAGWPEKRRAYSVHSIIKNEIFRKIGQNFLGEEYFDGLLNSPRAFCEWCAKRFSEKIANPLDKDVRRKISFCCCKLCAVLKRAEYTDLFEVNGHYTTCPSQVK